MKKVRTIRIDKDISDNLDSICVRHGDVSWHIEAALTNYFESLEKPKPKAKKAVAKFIKPELHELAAYFHEKGSQTCNDDAQKFLDHYSSNGWKVGKNQMKDWKAAVRNWMRGKGNENNKSGSAKRLSVSERQAETRRQGEQIRANLAASSGDNSFVGEDGADIRGQVVHTIR